MSIQYRSHRTTRAAQAVVAAACICLPAFASSAEEPDNHQHAHVHGIASLGIAVQDDVVTLAFESPLDSVIGFEHRANTPAERSSVDKLQARMKAPGDLFRLTPAAECKLQKAEAESAIFNPPAAGAAADAHADLDASFEYRCAHIDRLASVDVGLFDAYPRLQKVAVEVASGKGQFKRDLQRPARIVSLSR